MQPGLSELLVQCQFPVGLSAVQSFPHFLGQGAKDDPILLQNLQPEKRAGLTPLPLRPGMPKRPSRVGRRKMSAG